MLRHFIIIIFLINFIVDLNAMENKLYHHLKDGSFRNPEGSPVRDTKFKWSYKVFNNEKKKLNMIMVTRTGSQMSLDPLTVDTYSLP